MQFAEEVEGFMQRLFAMIRDNVKQTLKPMLVSIGSLRVCIFQSSWKLVAKLNSLQHTIGLLNAAA